MPNIMRISAIFKAVYLQLRKVQRLSNVTTDKTKIKHTDYSQIVKDDWKKTHFYNWQSKINPGATNIW